MKRSVLAVIGLALWVGACAHTRPVELADFKSDGCSLFPDGSYYGCCYVHDFAYWPGGTADERKQADKALRACVRGVTGSGARAGLMSFGTRAGGGPGWPTWYRWGFGWPFPYRAGYAPLTAAERAQVVDKTRKLCATIKLDPATGGFVVDTGREITAAQARQICPGL